MARYAKIVSGEVENVIIADASFISGQGGQWELSPNDAAGMNSKFADGLFVSNLPATKTLTAPDELTLSVVADNQSGTLTYQWKKDASNITDETSASLVIDPSTASTDDGDYTCEVSDGTNTLESNACTVTVI